MDTHLLPGAGQSAGVQEAPRAATRHACSTGWGCGHACMLECSGSFYGLMSCSTAPPDTPQVRQAKAIHNNSSKEEQGQCREAVVEVGLAVLVPRHSQVPPERQQDINQAGSNRAQPDGLDMQHVAAHLMLMNGVDTSASASQANGYLQNNTAVLRVPAATGCPRAHSVQANCK